jgi:protein O-GlcNAc transferase
VLTTNPDSPSDLYEKALLYARRGDLAAAEPYYRRSVHLDPWFGPAQADFGIVLHRLGRTEEAERRLRYAARWFPETEKPVSELGHLLFESGRYSEAAAAYRKAVRLGRSDLAPRLAEAERRAGGAAS